MAAAIVALNVVLFLAGLAVLAFVLWKYAKS